MSAISQLNAKAEDRADLYEDAAYMLRNAIQVQGLAALTCTREHAARHEAGHVIQHKAEGNRVLSVQVYPRGKDWLGKTNTGKRWRVDHDTDPQADLAQVRILLAGPFAEYSYCANPAFGAGVDELALARRIASTVAFKLGVDFQALLLKAIADTGQPIARHRSAFDAVTAALLIRKKVKGFELLRLLRDV
jgi:hypothetical protein